jgi:hypothetical protein
LAAKLQQQAGTAASSSSSSSSSSSRVSAQERQEQQAAHQGAGSGAGGGGPSRRPVLYVSAEESKEQVRRPCPGQLLWPSMTSTARATAGGGGSPEGAPLQPGAPAAPWCETGASPQLAAC